MDKEQYQVSKYNLYFEDASGHKFIWNSVENVLRIVDECDFKRLRNGSWDEIDNKKRIEFFESGFLIQVNFDETKELIRKINYFASDALPHYRILTTTGCNAACEYCYEKGLPVQHMTSDTAVKTAEFICRQATKTLNVLEWFGGEPLMNSSVINTICEQLKTRGLRYKSVMESNGSLFDSQLISCAAELWNLKRVQITLDGVNRRHETIKKLEEGTFAKTIHNIHMLLDAGVKVNVRIIHTGDIARESEIIYFLDKEFPICGKRPSVYLSPLYKAGKAYESDYIKQIIKLNRILIETKFATAESIYDMRRYSGRCFASNIGGYTIAPDGTLYNCSHNMSSAQRAGTIWLEAEPDQVRREFVFHTPSEECGNCILFPICQGGCRIAEMKLAPMTQCHIFKNVIKEVLLERLRYADSGSILDVN